MSTGDRIPGLSKSRFMAGRQCHKRLYLECYDPALAGPSSDFSQAAFDIGHTVGALGRDRFPGGRLIAQDFHDHAGAELATEAALGDGSLRAIYEGAFSFDDVRIRADVLDKVSEGKFDLFEVKSTLDPKPEHEWDVAIQLYVLEGASIPIRRAYVVHLNRDYVYSGGAYDLEALFTAADVTDLAREHMREIVSALKAMRDPLRGESPPDIAIGGHCTTPYVCPFYDHCHKGQPDNPIDELPRLRNRLRKQLAALGIVDITKIPSDFDALSPLQARVADTVRGQIRFHDPAIQSELAAVAFPVHFLDFETFMPALPLYSGTRPYQMIPFQWSDHVLSADGAVVHREFLHADRTDPRRPFAEALSQVVSGPGSIVVYSSFEAARLRELEDQYSDLAPSLRGLRERIFDLLPVIRAHIYDREFHGSFSIKNVLPALIPEFGYEDLEVSDGNLASLAYVEMQALETTPERIAQLRSALLAYCKRDTEAMLELFRLLR
jgi:hypothetical protein